MSYEFTVWCLVPVATLSNLNARINMILEIIEAIKDWPVIVQGALGSALFWLISLVAQRIVAIGVVKASKHSNQERLSWLVSRNAKHEAFGGTRDDAKAAYATSSLIYRSLRPVYKGVIWLGLGLVASVFTPIGLAIGGVGLTYYFLKAYDVVSPISFEENTKEEWDKVRTELLERIDKRIAGDKN